MGAIIPGSSNTGVPLAGRYRVASPANGALASVVTTRPNPEEIGMLRWSDDAVDAYNDWTQQTIGTASGTVTVGIWADSANGNDTRDGLDGLGVTLSIGSTFTVSTLTLTKTNAFTNVSAGDIIYLKSGTNLTPGYYTIVTKTDNSNVILDRSCSSNGSNLSTLTAASGPVKTLKKVQDLHDAWNGSGVLGIFMKRGGVWQGNTTTTGGTGATEAAPIGLVVGHKVNNVKIIVKDYGNPGSPCPRLTTFNLMAHASIAKTGGRTHIYEYATSNNVAWVRSILSVGGADVYMKFDGSGTLATNLTAMDLQPGTWYWDSGTNKIYFHMLTDYMDPTVGDMLEYASQNDTTYSGAAGDGFTIGDPVGSFNPDRVRVENIHVEGYGMQKDATGQNGNTKSNYAFHGFIYSNAVAYLRGCTGIYCQRHAMANTGGGSGGIWVTDQCRMGCTVGDGLQYVSYAGGGAQVGFCRECEFTAGMLYRQSKQNTGQGYGLAHTSAGGVMIGFLMGIRNRIVPGQCQCTGLMAADPTTVPTFTTSSDCISFCIGDEMIMRDPTAFDRNANGLAIAPYANYDGDIIVANATIWINCKLRVQQVYKVDALFGWSMTPSSKDNSSQPSAMYNCDIIVDVPASLPYQLTSYQFDNAAAAYNGGSYHNCYGCRFHWEGSSVSSIRMFTAYVNGSVHGKAAGNIFSSSPALKDTADRYTYPHAVLAWNNDASQLFGNAYCNLGEITDATAGYSNDATKIELASVPTGRPGANSPLVRTLTSNDKPYTRRLEYDIDSRPRSKVNFAVGPWETI